mgnify:CR=1 FL=1
MRDANLSTDGTARHSRFARCNLAPIFLILAVESRAARARRLSSFSVGRPSSWTSVTQHSFSGRIHEASYRTGVAACGARFDLIRAPGARLARNRPVGVVRERSVGAWETAVVVHARAVREAPWRAGGAVVARRGEPRTAALEAGFPTVANADAGVVRVNCGRVLHVLVKLRFANPVDVGVGTRPGRLSMKWET